MSYLKRKKLLVMFTNYYKLINLSPSATDEIINEAISQSTLSGSLTEEIRMVLKNKKLKALYDEELKVYEQTEYKKDYQISNPTLEREIRKVKAYISNKARETVQTIDEEPKKSSNAWLWILIFIVVSCLGKCISSYNRGRSLEENRQKYLRGEYDNISINPSIFKSPNIFKPVLK